MIIMQVICLATKIYFWSRSCIESSSL